MQEAPLQLSHTPDAWYGLPKPDCHPLLLWKHQINCFLILAMCPLTVQSLQPTWLQALCVSCRCLVIGNSLILNKRWKLSSCLMLRSRHSTRKTYFNCKEHGEISNQHLIHFVMCPEYQNMSRRKKSRGAELGEFVALAYIWFGNFSLFLCTSVHLEGSHQRKKLA